MVSKKRKSVSTKNQKTETDGSYLLKLVMYIVLGSLWVKITKGDGGQTPIPVGFVVGVIFAMHDHFQIDRKIEYAVLLLAMFLGFWLPIGIFVSL
jgi:hypothetical protein